MKAIIKTEEAPEAIGPYSQAVRVGDQLFISGQIALEPSTGKMVKTDIAAETRQVLKNAGAILKAAGMDYNNVVQATIYLANMEDFAVVNSVYAEVFKDDPPSRATVGVSTLPRNAAVEMTFIAVQND